MLQLIVQRHGALVRQFSRVQRCSRDDDGGAHDRWNDDDGSCRWNDDRSSRNDDDDKRNRGSGWADNSNSYLCL